MIIGANHLALSVPDLDRAQTFYRHPLGFKVAFEFGWEPGSPMSEAAGTILAVQGTAARTTVLKAGNLLLEIFEFQAGNPKPQDPNRPVIDHGFTHLCFAVKDVDGGYERLTAAGMTFHSPPVQAAPGVKTVYGRDPFGNVLEFEEVEGRESAAQRALGA